MRVGPPRQRRKSDLNVGTLMKGTVSQGWVDGALRKIVSSVVNITGHCIYEVV